MKLITLISTSLLGVLALSGSAFAVALTNDGSYMNLQWGSAASVPFSKNTGTGGTAPYLSGTEPDKELVLTMEGATGGQTTVYSGFTTAMDFIITTRVAVDQFPDVTGWGSYPNFNGIQIANIKQDDYLVAQLTSTQLHIAAWAGGGTTIDINTGVGTFYTWQFQVSQAAGTGTGTVTIYRREDDSDPWSLVGENILILNADFGDMLAAGTILYNGDNTQIQGILRQEYFMAGVAVPEPSAAMLLSLGAGAFMLWRMRRRRAA